MESRSPNLQSSTQDRRRTAPYPVSSRQATSDISRSSRDAANSPTSGWNIDQYETNTWNSDLLILDGPATISRAQSGSTSPWMHAASPWDPSRSAEFAPRDSLRRPQDPWNRQTSEPQRLPFSAVGQIPVELAVRSASSSGALGHPSDDLASPPAGSSHLPNTRPIAILNSSTNRSSQRLGSNKDEFDGPHQLLDKPTTSTGLNQNQEPSESSLPMLPSHLEFHEQDQIISQVTTCLCCCAFHFVALYQFPIPLEQNKRPVRVPEDREWNEWVFLLKRLATKRRIPARVLYNQEIRQFNTILENSLELRGSTAGSFAPLPTNLTPGGTAATAVRQRHGPSRTRSPKDDRHVLQVISAGLQVAKSLKDASAMTFLDRLYVETESLINSRK